jgi:hypothetical protein
MKIHQIHEYGGSYEDYCDRIVGTYLLEPKAIAEKERLEAIEAEHEKCRNCPLYVCLDDNNDFCNNDCGESCHKHILSNIAKYCDKYEDDGDDHCTQHYWYRDSRTYEIKEVDVIE